MAESKRDFNLLIKLANVIIWLVILAAIILLISVIQHPSMVCNCPTPYPIDLSHLP